MSFISDIEEYKDFAPPGVRLPKINIEQKYYDELGISNTSTNYEFLTNLCRKGFKDRGLIGVKNKKDYGERVKMELEILEELGFTDYILLNWDILNFCHENSIPTGPGRGSAAGSLVLYLIGVTQVDPIKYSLFFERFVSKSRAKKTIKDGITYLDGSLLADVDNDIAFEHRQEVIKYIEDRYPGRTCKILTLNTLSGKLCVKECGKIAAGMTEQEVNDLSDVIPKKFGKVAPLKEAKEEAGKFKDWAEANPLAYNICRKLENLNKNTGVHPSGIAISYDKLEDICPMQTTGDGDIVSGYDMNWVAELTVKFDILGLRTLSVIYNVCKEFGINPVTDIPIDEGYMYEPLRELKTPQGLFQIEADTNYRVCRKIKPRDLEELSAVVAIARPGAMDFLDDFVKFVETNEFQSVHKLYDEILEYTGGIPLYQEQLMQMAVKIGFTLDEAEQLRRIVGKKKVELMPAWKQKIEDKIKENDLPTDAGDVLWKVAEDSANYSFNKSHSISYAMLAAWTTYLKFVHPQEFYIALLRMTKNEQAPQEEIQKISQELGYFKLDLLPPDLAKSEMDFSKEGRNIRYGLNSIKGVSEKSLEALQSFRESDSPNKYEVFVDAKQAGLNIGILSALIQAGALSSCKTARSRMVLEAQAFNNLTPREQRNFMLLGEECNFNLLKNIIDVKNDERIGDDNKKIMTEKRFNTFKEKFKKYRDIYDKNKEYETFANWYFENKLLGYSYTSRLKDIFSTVNRPYKDSQFFWEEMNNDEADVFIGTVTEVFKKKTQKDGTSYVKVTIVDEVGSVQGMMGDWGKKMALSKYLDKGGVIPEKGSIITIAGRKSDDILFLDNMSVLDQKIYMKLSDVK